MKCICGQRMTRTTKNYHPAYKCSCGKIEVNNQITYITEHAKVKISNQELYDIYAIDFAKYIIDNDLFFALKYGRIEYINLIKMFKKEKQLTT